jgi:heterodisulfide reductase subunit A
MMTIEHARAEAMSGHGNGEVQCQIFFMDTRSYSKGYEEYYQRAEKKYGVKYTRCRLSDIKEDPQTKNLKVRYWTNSSLLEAEFDLVVLSVGMEISDSVKSLGNQLGIELDPYGFCHTTLFDPLSTTRNGIFVAGPFREPKDIPETVIEASGAAANAAQLLSPARHTLAVKQDYPLERDITGEDTRIGVFVCHCGSNIGGYLDVPDVANYAQSLPGVIHAEDNLYTCSQDTIAHIIATIQEKNLNRVVVSSCTPLTHEPLFQDAIRQAGLNPYLFEMANIRNQCSWVHSNDYDQATEKARMLTRMAVARAAKLEPLKVSAVPVNHTALIIGGGVAGMTAALVLAAQDFPVHLVERSEKLGGQLHNLKYFIPENRDSNISSPQDYLSEIVSKVKNNSNILIHLNTEIDETRGFKGNFTTALRSQDEFSEVQHGAIIVATGGEEYHGNEYCYGQDERVLTQLEFERRLANYDTYSNELSRNNHQIKKPSTNHLPNSVVMILCVGPAEKFCSRLCCTTALKNAIKLKEFNPSADITILFRDIRTYGFKERLYTEARRQGVQFIQFDFENKPIVEILNNEEQNSVTRSGQKPTLAVKVFEPILRRKIRLTPDLLVLSTPAIPSSGTKELASKLKISTDMDGFFLEAHVKLRPVDFSADGIFMAGMAHYPKFFDEAITQAQAAASRAASILAQDTILTNARVARVDPALCVGCLTCVRICPYEVPKVSNEFTGVGSIVGAAFVEPAICHGCGSCVAECPAQAIQLMHYTDIQTLSKVDALFKKHPDPSLVLMDDIEVK